MEFDTIIILGLLVSALSWWVTIHVKEERQVINQVNAEAKDKLERAERVRRLTNKL